MSFVFVINVTNVTNVKNDTGVILLKRSFLKYFLLAALAAIFMAGGVMASPAITSMTPTTGLRYDPVTLNITGTSFATTGVTVTLTSSTPATSYPLTYLGSTTTTSITCAVIPTNIAVGSYWVQVTVSSTSNVSTASSSYTATAASPTVTSVVPSTAARNIPATIAINGTNFANTAGTTITLTGTTPLTSTPIPTFTAASSKSYTGVVIPANLASGTYWVTVSNTDGTNSSTAGSAFTVTPFIPIVTSVVNNFGYSGSATTVTINGTNFMNVSATTAVSLIGTSSTVQISSYTVASNTTLTGVIIPQGTALGTYFLSVTGTDGTSTTGITSEFIKILPLPALTAVTPNNFNRNVPTTVAITGSGFTGVTAITLTGPSPTPITSYSFVNDTSITGVVIPSGLSPGSYYLWVTNTSGTSAASLTCIIPYQYITGVSPASIDGTVVTQISIFGGGFFGGTNTSYVSSVRIERNAISCGSPIVSNLSNANDYNYSFSTFNVVNDTQITVWSSSSMTFGTYNVRVVNYASTPVTSCTNSANQILSTVKPTVTTSSPSTFTNTSSATITQVLGTLFAAGSNSNIPYVTGIYLDTSPVQVSASSFAVAGGSAATIYNAVFPAGIKTGIYNVSDFSLLMLARIEEGVYPQTIYKGNNTGWNQRQQHEYGEPDIGLGF